MIGMLNWLSLVSFTARAMNLGMLVIKSCSFIDGRQSSSPLLITSCSKSLPSAKLGFTNYLFKAYSYSSSRCDERRLEWKLVFDEYIKVILINALADSRHIHCTLVYFQLHSHFRILILTKSNVPKSVSLLPSLYSGGKLLRVRSSFSIRFCLSLPPPLPVLLIIFNLLLK